ncbi:hypothetical protein DI53_3550 [Sphingobacterium deserti]|uniref:Uncharacterized protein n=2 Tax=Sphingobacterium deserti TaxID=1229276 RepID=A0A0B8T647_9SPHI|nr:hypothetical protein DI53_3550 [Sphingobacterium deserti]
MFGSALYAQPTQSKLDEIAKAVKKINAATLQLETKRFWYENKCGVNKASITIFYKDHEIQKIVDMGEGDGDKAALSWSYEYYYANGELIFSYESIQYFDNQANRDMQEESRQYFDKDYLIKQIKDGETTYPVNFMIDSDDLRYELKKITRSSDIDRIYRCPDL